MISMDVMKAWTNHGCECGSGQSKKPVATISANTRINGICKLSKKTGYSRYHIQKVAKGERKASDKLAKILTKHGIEPNDQRMGFESGTCSFRKDVTPEQIAEACGLKGKKAV